MGDKEVMLAILECYWPAINTFVMPNGKLGFSLREIKEITGLPILGELSKDYVSLDSEHAIESEDFWALFFLVMAFFEYTREGRDKSKCLRWYNESGTNEEHRAENKLFNGDGVYRKVKRDKNLSDVPVSFKFYQCRDFLARMDEKFVGITMRFKPTLYLTNWLREAIFFGGGGKEIRATTI